MNKSILSVSLLLGLSMSAFAQTDAYIKLRDEKKTHPRIESITFPGDANTRYMYDAIYGHGAVIENPWVAYRVYMDNRQSLDLYVKQTPQLELDVTGFYTTPEQLKEGYGIDVLWAGKSIGAGSFRGLQNGQPMTIDTVASRTQKVLDDHTIQVIDKDWIYNGHPIQMTQTYSMSPNSRDLFVEIKLDGYLPDEVFATGIQKLETDNQGFINADGRAASWGSNIPDKGHPEIVEQVGLGIIVDPENIVATEETDLNYLVTVRPNSEGIIRYRVIAAGDREKNGFNNYGDWSKYIKSLKYTE
ncbi:MAG: DUF4861 domain-containing protein [Muribaculaceae bacterium]|nr:DUF4861 domain-containing protein [Muribaculaceae bacterium]MDE6521599.1 DUF4861 domain-containing protein [Muribaculaceae bacterium]